VLETCGRTKLHMVLNVGGIQFLSKAHILHARTADSGMLRWHLMRL